MYMYVLVKVGVCVGVGVGVVIYVGGLSPPLSSKHDWCSQTP